MFKEHIQYQHKLTNLNITLDGWRNNEDCHEYWIKPRWAMTRPQDDLDLAYWRNRLLNQLKGHMRGVRCARIVSVNDNGAFGNKSRKDLSMFMAGPARSGETPVKKDSKRRLGLGEALANVERRGKRWKTDEGVDWSWLY